MPSIPANLGPLRTSRGTFTPYGPLIHLKPLRNPERLRIFSARIAVGLSVGDVPTYSIEDVISLVERFTAYDASFILQRGLFTSRKTGKRVREDSVQIIILDDSGAKLPVFRAEMKMMAQQICNAMQQETVLLELQRNGVQVSVSWIVP